jgi:hypothetical protein
MRLIYVEKAYVKNEMCADDFRGCFSVCAIRCEKRRVKNCPMAKSKKNKNKAKLNLTVRGEQRNKLEQMASLEKRSVSNLIEVMADERWARLAGQQGIAYAKTVADAMNRKLDMDNAADREKLRRAVLDLVAVRKMSGQKDASLGR